MPSEPHSLDELKLPFIFVPRDAPEPTEWMVSHRDWIKLPTTLEPDAQRDGGAKRSSGSPPPSGQSRSLERPAAPPGPAAPSPLPPAIDTTSGPARAAANHISDRASSPDEPIAAFRRANDALATSTIGHASGRAGGFAAPIVDDLP